MPNKRGLKLYNPVLIVTLSKPKMFTKIKEPITQAKPDIPALKLNIETTNNSAPKILFCEKNKIA